MSIISKKEVEHVAKLAELQFSDTELTKITSELDKILGHVVKISEVDTSDIHPTSHTLKINNVFREDKVQESLPVDEVLANAPKKTETSFNVPKVVEGE